MALHQELCGRCGKEVYHAEKKVAINKVWHQYCFNCVVCHKVLNPNTYSTHRGELYCQQCYFEATSYEFDLTESEQTLGLQPLSSKKFGQSTQTEQIHSGRRTEILESSNILPSEIKNVLRNRINNKIEETDQPSGRNIKNNCEESNPPQHHKNLPKGNCKSEKDKISQNVQTTRSKDLPKEDSEEKSCETVLSSIPNKSEKDKIVQNDETTRSKSLDRLNKLQRKTYTFNEEEENNKLTIFTANHKILPSFLCKGDNCTVPKNVAYSELVYEDAGCSSSKKEDNNRKYNILKRLKMHINKEMQVNYIPTTYKCDILSSTMQKEETLFISKSGKTKIVKITCPKIKKNENIVDPNKQVQKSKVDPKLNNEDSLNKTAANSKELETPEKQSSLAPKETSKIAQFWKKLLNRPVELPKNSLEEPVEMKQPSSNDLIRVRSCMKKSRASTDELNIDTFKTHTKRDSKDHIKHESNKKPNKANARQSVASITVKPELIPVRSSMKKPLRSRANTQKINVDVFKTRKKTDSEDHILVKHENNKISNKLNVKQSVASITTGHGKNRGKYILLITLNPESSNSKLDKKEANQKEIEKENRSPNKSSNQIKKTAYDTALEKSKKDRQNKSKSKLEYKSEEKQESYPEFLNPFFSSNSNKMKKPSDRKVDFAIVDHNEEKKKEENIYKRALRSKKNEDKSRDKDDNYKKKEDRGEQLKLCKNNGKKPVEKKESCPKISNSVASSNEMKKPKEKKNYYTTVEDFYSPIPYSVPKRDHKEENKNEDKTKEENMYKGALRPNKKEDKSRDKNDNHKKKEDRNEEWKLCKYPVYMYAQTTNDKSTKKKNSKEDLPKTASEQKNKDVDSNKQVHRSKGEVKIKS